MADIWKSMWRNETRVSCFSCAHVCERCSRNGKKNTHCVLLAFPCNNIPDNKAQNHSPNRQTTHIVKWQQSPQYWSLSWGWGSRCLASSWPISASVAVSGCVAILICVCVFVCVLCCVRVRNVIVILVVVGVKLVVLDLCFWGVFVLLSVLVSVVLGAGLVVVYVVVLLLYLC